MKTPFIRIILCLVVWPVLFINVTSADIIDTYGFSAQNMGKGGAICASVNDGSSVFYNPAGLGMVSGFDLNLSYFRTFSSMEISDAPASAPDNDDLSFGAVQLDLGLNLNRLLNTKKNIVFGLGLVAMDDGSIVMLEDVEESTYSYVQFGATLQRITIYTGVGMEIIRDTLWLGIGGHAIIAGNAAANLTLETSALTTEEPTIPASQDIWMEMEGTLEPLFGVIYKPGRNLNLGFSFKDAIAADIERFDANLNLKLGEYSAKIPALLAILSSWSPRIYRAGASYTMGKAALEVNLAREEWSEFNRGAVRDVRRVAPEFKDIDTWHFGATYKKSDKTNLFAGYIYAPTPVPDQPGESNYLGSDRHILSIGGERKFENLFGKLKYPLWVGVALQEQFFEERTFVKSDGGSYQLDGNIFSFIFSFRLCSESDTPSEN